MLAVGEVMYSNKRSIVFSGWGKVGQNYLQVLTPKLDVDKKTKDTVRVIMISLGVIFYMRSGSTKEPVPGDRDDYQRLADDFEENGKKPEIRIVKEVDTRSNDITNSEQNKHDQDNLTSNNVGADDGENSISPAANSKTDVPSENPSSDSNFV